MKTTVSPTLAKMEDSVLTWLVDLNVTVQMVSKGLFVMKVVSVINR